MPLKILKASAGSGKTFQLTRHYLELCLRQPNPMFFQHILAITFTNKATQEMKEKILHACKDLAQLPQESDHLAYFKEKLQLSEEEISRRAERILDSILTNYGKFSISTIDSFFQRVLRAFAREIKINDAYDIRLDTHRILGLAIDEMIDQLDDKHDATEGIRSMIDTRLEDQKSWRFDEDLVNFGREIFKEELIGKEPLNEEELIKIKHQLRKRNQEIDEKYFNYQEEVLGILAQNELQPIDFSGKTRSFISAFTSAKNGFEKFINMASISNAIDQINKWYTKSAPEEIKESIENIYAKTNQILIDVSTFAHENILDYNTTKAILKNFDSFILLAAIQKAVKGYMKRENIFPLANTQPLLKDVISTEQAPFLYERIGSHYKYYLIDEFQDTSVLQFENMTPLIDEAMSHEKYDSLMVGDTKQAIYRWRSGDWEILEYKVPEKYPTLKQQILESNYRSYEKIISFNNNLFAKASAFFEQVILQELKDEEDKKLEVIKGAIQKIYHNASQKLGRPDLTGGYCEINRLNALDGDLRKKEDRNSYFLLILKEKIIELETLGFTGRDICILYRNNREGDLIAKQFGDWQSENHGALFKFQSDEALYIKNSDAVIATISFLNLLQDGSNFIARLNLWQKLSLLKISDEVDYSIIGNDSYFDNVYSPIKELFDLEETSDVLQMAQLFWERTQLFQHPNERAFLSVLQDEIISFARVNGNDITGFIEHFYDIADELKVKGDPTEEGIKLMSIHQSKGLEFEVVIIPFATWDFKMKGNMWVDGGLSPVPIKSRIPISKAGKLTLENSHFRDDYFEERIRNYIDNLNLLYVATTRAVQHLYIFTLEGKTKLETNNTVPSPSSIADLLQFVYSFKENDGTERFSVFSFGDIANNKSSREPNEVDSEIIPIKFNIRQKFPTIKEGEHPEALELESAKSEEREAMSKGYIIHHLLEDILSVEDVEQSINNSIQDGIIYKSEKGYFKRLLDQILSDQKMAPWLSNENELIIERDVLMPNGKIYRPDRVAVKQNETLILDFKSGVESDSHKKQVYQYMRILEKMHYKAVKGFIYYTADQKLIQI